MRYKQVIYRNKNTNDKEKMLNLTNNQGIANYSPFFTYQIDKNFKT